MRRLFLKKRRTPGILMLHLSFLFIVAGALLTCAFREKGYVKIVPEENSLEFRDGRGELHALPASLSLDSFEVVYYPGSDIPRDYVSHLKVDGHKSAVVSMNRILEIDGYRFCQAGYTPDGSTILTVNHDPYGMWIVYAGYVLFAVGGFLMLISRRGKWRRIISSLSLFSLLLFPSDISAANIADITVEVADSVSSRQVLYQGRVVTFNTLSRDVVTKLYGKPCYRGLSPEQTLLSMRRYPGKWKNEPLIQIKDRSLGDELGIDGTHATFSQLFDSDGNYRVSPIHGVGDRKYTRAVEELDEKVGIILALYEGTLIVDASGADEVLSPWRVSMELLYNTIPFTSLIFIVLFCGALLSFLSFSGKKWLWLVALTTLWIALALSATCFVLQWLLSGHMPLSNTYETLLFSVFIFEVLILFSSRYGKLLLAVGMLFAGSMALVAHFMEVNPVVTPLMPVLHSPWLSWHVSLVMTSYSLLGLTFVVSVVALVSPRKNSSLRRLSLAALYPAEWLLGLGIITGSVWANVSWGEYWSWDPKETLSLVTFIVYALPLHTSIRFLRKPRNYHFYMLCAILTVAMTYFGVNLFNSMHAYS